MFGKWLNKLSIWVFGPGSLKVLQIFEMSGRAAATGWAEGWKNTLIRNKNPKLLLVLLFAHQSVLQILTTWVHFHVFIAPTPQAPQHSQYVVLLLSAIIDCQLPPGKLSFSLFKSRCQRTLSPLSLHSFPVDGSQPLFLCCSWCRAHRWKDPRWTLPGRIQETLGRKGSRITSREGLGWERIVTEHVEKGRYGSLKF